METQEAGADQLTPQQAAESKIENLLFPQAEPEPPTEQPEAELEPELEGEFVEEPDPDDLDALEVEGEEVEEQVTEPEMFEMEIDGQLYEVPEPIKNQLEQAQDYTAKTQQVSEQRKTLETLTAEQNQAKLQNEFLESVADERNQAERLEWQMGELRTYMRNNIDNLSGQDLEKVRWQIEEYKTEQDGLVRSMQAKWQSHQQAAEQSQSELRAKSTEAMKSRLPNWSDEAHEDTKKFGLTVGYSQEEVDAAVDPRDLHVLWMASQYMRLKAGQPAAIGKARAASAIRPKGARDTVKPETRRKISIRKRLNNAKRAGASDKETAKMIQQDLEDRGIF